MIKKINLNTVTLFRIGYIKIAPGTVASLFTTLILYLLLTYGFKGIEIYIIYFLIFLFLYSLYAIGNLKNHFEKSDPKEIVIDEVVGQSLVIILATSTSNNSSFQWYIYYFLIFRLFDIVKIFPCNLIDRKMKNSLGVMLDDIIAAIYSVYIPPIILMIGLLMWTRLGVWIN